VSEKDTTGGGASWGVHPASRASSQNLSMRQLAEVAKISNPYLSQVERGLYKPSADVLKNIANALHILGRDHVHPGRAARRGREGRGSPRGRAGDRSSIRCSPTDQKEALIRIYRSFAAGGG